MLATGTAIANTSAATRLEQSACREHFQHMTLDFKQPWSFPPDEVARRAGTDPDAGLTQAEAERRLQQYGPNRLKDDGGLPWWRLLLRQFADLLIGLLAVAAVVSALIGEWPDAVLIAVIVVANAVIGFVQEWRAEKAVAALQALSEPAANVLRDGHLREIAAAELAPGDVIDFAAGDFIPADARLAQTTELEIDEAAMTGESLPAEKTLDAVDADAPVPDRHCMVHSGTAVMRGHGRGIITATGMSSELGRIATMLSEAESGQTPLQRRMAELSKRLAYAVVAVCVAIFAAGVLRKSVAEWNAELFNHMLLVSVSLAVAAVPEGLPAVITVALALGSQRMARRNAIVRRLSAVETLGSVTVICTDKTGTLTQNRMTASELIPSHQTDDRRVESRESRVQSQNEATNQESGSGLSTLDSGLARLLTAAVLCNDAAIDAQGQPTGSPTETAILQAALDRGFDVQSLRGDFPRLDELAFSSQRKRMATLHGQDGGFVLFVKGAAEQVLERCDFTVKSVPDARSVRDAGEPLSDTARDEWEARAAELAGRGRRVLAVAQRRWDAPQLGEAAEGADSSLSLLGLIALVDPIREEAAGSIEECRSAGIRPVMITGDHAGTANAIADDASLRSGDDLTLTGRELTALSVEQLGDKIDDVSVFARVAPEHKLRIVKAYQSRGHVVAMTGDGVNDGPALKQADIGVAMGITGTDVAKASADMILADDNFATIVAAVEEGRVVYDNIRKFVVHLLSTNVGEIIVVAAAILAGFPIPLLPGQILWINLITDGLPALALGFEPAEKDIMRRPPRRKDETLFDRWMVTGVVGIGLLMGLATLAIFAFYLSREPASLPPPPGGTAGEAYVQAYARTMTFLVLVMFQLFYVLGIRSTTSLFVELGPLSNWRLTAAVVIGTGLQFAVIYVPWLQVFFHTVPLSPGDVAIGLGVASTAFLLVESRKLVLRSRSATESTSRPRS
jgi:Ca2+-transporting ATPase